MNERERERENVVYTTLNVNYNGQQHCCCFFFKVVKRKCISLFWIKSRMHKKEMGIRYIYIYIYGCCVCMVWYESREVEYREYREYRESIESIESIEVE